REARAGEDPGGRRRRGGPFIPRPGAAAGGVPGGGRRRRPGGPAVAQPGVAGRGDPGPRVAGARRPGGVPTAAGGRGRHAGPDADGPRRRRRPRAGAGRRGRRLPGEAVRPGRAAGPPPGAAAAAVRSRGRGAAVRRPVPRPRDPGGPPGRPPVQPHPDRVRPARAVPAAPPAGADPGRHLGPGVGVHVRLRDELPGGVRRLPPPQDRGRGREPVPAHRPWGGVRAQRVVTFRSRLVLVAAAAVIVAVLAACAASYFVARHALYGSVDATLANTAATINRNQISEGGAGGIHYQFTSPNGVVIVAGGLPVTADVRAVAGGKIPSFFTDITLHGRDYRELVHDNGTTPFFARVGIPVLTTPAALQV